MKKNSLFLLLLIPLIYQAQIRLNETRLGIIGGGTYSRVTDAHNPSGPRFSILGGLILQTPIGDRDQFYLELQTLYLGAGETGRAKNAKGRPGYDTVYANNYLSLPLSMKVYLTGAESEFFVLGGPRFNFLIQQKVKNSAKAGYEITSFGKANNFNFGLGAGIGYSFKRMIEMTLRYDHGITNTYPDLSQYPAEIGLSGNTDRKYEQVLSLSFSYFFR